MRKRIGWGAILAFTASLGLTLPATGGGGKQKLRSDELRLFNGRNLNGWDTWLGKPHKGDKVLGLNNDPKKVFSVVSFEGQPAIRISGEIYGALTTRQEYENYSVRLEFKWGRQKWPPRENTYRDSGLLYHCVGKHGAAGTYWMQSLECQIMEEQCGDLWCVADTIAEVQATPLKPNNPLIAIRYDPKGKFQRVPRHIEFDEEVRDDPHVVRSVLNEISNNWNTIEVQTVGAKSVHIVNGKVVMVVNNARQIVKGVEQPLNRGRIQLQSEGAEVYFRNIVLRPITSLSAPLSGSPSKSTK
jgi:hypothetical protein